MQIKLRLLSIIAVIAPILFFSCSRASDLFEIHIVSSNDIHGYALWDEDSLIGYDDILMYTNLIRNNTNDVLLLDAGNFLQGSMPVNINQGKNAVIAKNLVGYDALSIGNHDFDFGGDRLLELTKLMNMPILAANSTFLAQPRLQSHIKFTLPDSNLSVTVIGIAPTDLYSKTRKNHIRGWDIYDPLPVIQSIVQQEAKTTDLFIIIGHLGTHNESLAQKILQQYPKVSLIIDGDSYLHGKSSIKQKNQMILQSQKNAQSFHHTTIKLDKVTHKVINISTKEISQLELSKLPLDETPEAVNQIRQLIQNIEEEITERFGEVIITLPVKGIGLKGDSTHNYSRMAKIVGDSQRIMTGADIAVVNAGSIRTGFQQDTISYGDLYNIMPWNNSIWTVEITGKDILQALELSVRYYPQPSTSFLHISGIEYSLNPKEKFGNRIHHVLINGVPIEKDRLYTVAGNSFLLAGGDGYDMFMVPTKERFGRDIDILQDYLKLYRESILEGIITPNIHVIS
ncbi:5'-nucleotidase C-terminal domain-containing protein [Entomospira entomophila]|uniref:Bifunctional metallophosphatase/5'-nucleotidase n=1 Tax=Entomospira entomophila TaxID=2719988 RepID=A0A968GD29_9SPIO|nr:5'-nucleotidase C-terminal domain-containing protein [Entomospira entomophilus]NIZ40219.1 hypothetical protein [Entomospira entomophilus]WDI35778.1 5'-nucleotidase C-terminal domain-containing protein [Entomospira entomophilus]